MGAAEPESDEMISLPAGRRRSQLGIALIVLPLLLQIALVATLGTNVLLGDEFGQTELIGKWESGGGWPEVLWRQHNEGRIIPSKVVVLANAELNHWRSRGEMYVSVVLAAFLLGGLWRIYRQVGEDADLLVFAPVAWLTCSWVHYESMLYGLRHCHYFTIAGVVWALALLPSQKPWRFAAAVMCGLVATFSVVTGSLIWPLGVLVLVAAKERRRLQLLVWTAAGGAASLANFHGYQLPDLSHQAKAGVARAVEVIGHFSVALGSPFAGGSLAWARGISAAIILLTAWFALRWMRGARSWRDDRQLIALALFGYACVLAVAVERTDTIPTLESRDALYSMLVPIALYILVFSSRTSGIVVRRMTATIMIAGILAGMQMGLYEARLFRAVRLEQRKVLLTFEQQGDEVLGRLLFPDQLREAARFLRDRKLSSFSESP